MVTVFFKTFFENEKSIFHISRFMINRETGKELTVLFLQVGQYKHHSRSIIYKITTGLQVIIGIIGIQISLVQLALITTLRQKQFMTLQ